MSLIVNKNRPINLDLSSMRFPLMAIASILHRISGIVLFILLPVMMYLLDQSLHSEALYTQLQNELAMPHYKVILWCFSTALAYHLIAGIRHIIMDLGFGEHVCTARHTAGVVIAMAVISTILLGMWIW